MNAWYQSLGLPVSPTELMMVVGLTLGRTVPTLFLNGRRAWVGEGFKNRPLTVIILVAALAFFAWIVARTMIG